MAFDDALFQLGMDLTRSSTAQKEDLGDTARMSCGGSSGPEAERSVALSAGHHLIIDLYDAGRLDDVEHVERTLRRCVEVAGASLLQVHLHPTVEGNGLAGIAIIAGGGHVSMHTGPAAGYAAVDVYMRGDARPHACLDVLKQAFATRDVEVRTQPRGLSRRQEAKWQPAEAVKDSPARQVAVAQRPRAKVKRAA